jgi:hypothetical protein
VFLGRAIVDARPQLRPRARLQSAQSAMLVLA